MSIIVNQTEVSVVFCNTFRKRFLGLMGKRKTLDQIYYFPNCNSIHMFFMFQAIDVIMLDKQQKVCYKKEKVQPWHLILPKKGAVAVLELPLHYSIFFEIGDPILWKEA